MAALDDDFICGKKKKKRKMRCLSGIKGLQPIFFYHFICLVFPCNRPGVNFRKTIGCHKIQLDFDIYEKKNPPDRTKITDRTHKNTDGKLAPKQY